MKNQEEDLLVYDEDDAVKFILNFLSSVENHKVDDIKIEYVLDVVYEYYEENGLIEEDSTEEASIDEEKMFNYILKCSKKDKIEISEDEIQMILEGEFEYGKSLGIYKEE
jgi:hypothetical protein